jgi:hypothetical protein
MAMTGTNIPAGWHYDAYTDSYKSTSGDVITRQELKNHNDSIDQVLVHRAYDAARQAMGANVSSAASIKPRAPARRSTGPGLHFPVNANIGDLYTDNSGEVFIYSQAGWITNNFPSSATGQITNGQIPISNMISNGGHFITAAVPPEATVTMQGKLGNITMNLDTGELTMPPNVGRDAAIRDFWLGFQEYWQPTNKAEYERKIKELQQEVTQIKVSSLAIEKEAKQNAAKKIADKFRKKYGDQKLIMVKPEDLARFIEGE